MSFWPPSSISSFFCFLHIFICSNRKEPRDRLHQTWSHTNGVENVDKTCRGKKKHCKGVTSLPRAAAPTCHAFLFLKGAALPIPTRQNCATQAHTSAQATTRTDTQPPRDSLNNCAHKVVRVSEQTAQAWAALWVGRSRRVPSSAASSAGRGRSTLGGPPSSSAAHDCTNCTSCGSSPLFHRDPVWQPLLHPLCMRVCWCARPSALWVCVSDSRGPQHHVFGLSLLFILNPQRDLKGAFSNFKQNVCVH